MLLVACGAFSRDDEQGAFDAGREDGQRAADVIRSDSQRAFDIGCSDGQGLLGPPTAHRLPVGEPLVDAREIHDGPAAGCHLTRPATGARGRCPVSRPCAVGS
ncbi:hypothetical protein, partial [Streptomyces sp. C1-2]|uniref:hypothetical protein n=1 Tax=Streptomyces sp. C1-2 TaxID=2720022 RepID=UPI0019D17A56